MSKIFKKKAIEKTPAPVVEKPKEPSLEELEKKRNDLICEMRPNLLNKAQLRRGGSDVRGAHGREISAWTPVLFEINELGKILGYPPVGLDQIRKG